MREIHVHTPGKSEAIHVLYELFNQDGCWRRTLHVLGNLTSSFAAAFGVFLLIPVLMWFATPNPNDRIICDPIGAVELPPPVVYVPPLPPKADDTEQKPDEIAPNRPDFYEIDLRPLPGVKGNMSIPGWRLETLDIGSLDDILELGEVDEVPQPIKQVAPGYPTDLKRLGIGSRVMLEFVVDESGNVQQAKVLDGEYPEFNKASLDAIRKWKFQPATKYGKAVKVRLRLPMDFHVK